MQAELVPRLRHGQTKIHAASIVGFHGGRDVEIRNGDPPFARRKVVKLVANNRVVCHFFRVAVAEDQRGFGFDGGSLGRRLGFRRFRGRFPFF